MLSDKAKLHAIIDRIEVGLINRDDIIALRGAVERLDELDDLVDAVCACRTQEIPILRGQNGRLLGCEAGELIRDLVGDDDAPGRP
jgi:hypothetical protein